MFNIKIDSMLSSGIFAHLVKTGARVFKKMVLCHVSLCIDKILQKIQMQRFHDISIYTATE